MREAVRVTTDPLFFETHAESTELWSPGSPLFTPPNDLVGVDAVSGAAFRAVLGSAAGNGTASGSEA